MSVFTREPINLNDASTLRKKWLSRLHEKARQDLERRGLDVTFAVAHKWEPLTAHEMFLESGQRKGPVIALTCHDISGNVGPHRRYRLVDKKCIEERNKGKRYSQPRRKGLVVFDYHEPATVSDAFRTVVIVTEGEIKASILCWKLDARVLSVPGVTTPWMKQSKKLRPAIIALFDYCREHKLSIELAYDSDAPGKPEEVMQYLLRFADAAKHAGIVVRIREIKADGKEKIGPDDLIMSKGAKAYLSSPLHTLDSDTVKKWRAAVAAIHAIPDVHLIGGHFDAYVGQCEALLSDTLYVRGGELVRIGVWAEQSEKPPLGPTIARSDEQPVIIPATQEYIKRKLNAIASFIKYTKDGESYEINCPDEIPRNIYGHGSWRLRPLAAIASAPFIRSDYTVCANDGYDARSGIYLLKSGEFPTIPKRPTKRDAERALATLMKPFDEFPYNGEESRAAFACHVLTCVARVTLPTSPIFFYTAPLAATGKTLLFQCPSLIATGTVPALHTYQSDEQELRKTITASLLAGDSSLLVDNVPNGRRIKSATLCTFATAPEWSDRILGVSKTPTLPNRCTMTLTGNNITPSSDLARRSLVCRLDVNSETARGRTFTIKDLIGYIHENRGELLAAALIIMRAYIFAERPEVDALPLESFVKWSQLVRDPLMWLGMADAVKSQASETDDENDSIGEAFDKLYAAFSDKTFVSRSITGNVTGNNVVRDALQAAGCFDPMEARSVGNWLGSNRDKNANGKKLSHAGDSKKGIRWQIKLVKTKKTKNREK